MPSACHGLCDFIEVGTEFAQELIDFGVFIQSTRNPFQLSIFRQAGEGIVDMAAATEVDKVILGAYMTPSVSVKTA